jgi:hypothetical protein
MSEFASETSQAAEEEVEEIQASPDAADPVKSAVENDDDVEPTEE